MFLCPVTRVACWEVSYGEWDVDYETDAVIQRSLREAVSKDTTVLTIAHRLQTIMDADKIVSACAGSLLFFVDTGD